MNKRNYHPIKGWHIVLMLLGGAASIQSWKWSFDILASLFGIETGGLLATMVTVVEIYFLIQFILTWNLLWLVGVLPGFIISIAGSYGNFQMNYEQNVEKSAAYQRKESEIAQLTKDRDAALDAARGYDETKQPWYAAKNRIEAKRLTSEIRAGEDELKTMTDEGVGSKNALFRSISRHTDISTLDSAERAHLGLGLFVELFMLTCTAIGASAKKRGYSWVRGNEDEYSVSWDEDGNLVYTKNAPKKNSYPSLPKPDPRPIPPKPPIPATAQGKGGNGVRPTPPERPRPKPDNQNSFKIDPGFRREEKKLTLNEMKKRAKEERKRRLKMFVSEHPESTLKQRAKAIGINSINTVKTYEKELGIR